MFVLMVVIAVEFEERGCRLTFRSSVGCSLCSSAGGDETAEGTQGRRLVIGYKDGSGSPLPTGWQVPVGPVKGLPVEKMTAVHHQSRNSKQSLPVSSNADWPSRGEDMPCNDLFHLCINQ